MKLHDRFIRRQLELMKPIADSSSLELTRSFQDKIGRLMQFTRRKDIIVSEQRYSDIPGALVIPREEVSSGVILYLHGGGYVCGSLEYARGVASILSSECGMRVFSLEYRLAPEAPYPAALDDAFVAYKTLLEHGYAPEDIILAGESAGAGLVYALAMRLRDEGEPLPSGIIAISPWCDLSLSGESHKTNRDRDPSLSEGRLRYFADCYVGAIKSGERSKHKGRRDADVEAKKKDPFVSPLFGDLSGMPPSIIIAGGDEILLSDSTSLHEALINAKSHSELHIKDGLWHAYILYSLKGNKTDYAKINDFLYRVLPRKNRRKLRWMHLDNAAKIYPAAASSRWTNTYRLSATMTEEVDRKILQSALDVTVRRFPSIAVRLRRGTFWYYLEEIKRAPEIRDEGPYPLVHMPFDDIRSCAFRVILYGKRIAVEFFHALTDGNGGLIFLKTLLAEYVTQRYGENIPTDSGILDRLEPPREDELEDSFPKHAATVGISRNEEDSYHIRGTPEEDGFCHNVTFMLPAKQLSSLAHEIGVTVTAMLTAAVILASLRLQDEDVTKLKRKKFVKVLVPIDLRRIFGSKTLRNFALYITPGVDARLGEYDFLELAHIVAEKMKLEITEKNLRARIYTNVHDEQVMALKLTPLFLKNIVMRAVFHAVGERKSGLTLSNLGVVRLPAELEKYVSRFDFVLSVQERAPYNAGLITYGDTAYLNVIRNIKEPRLEYQLYRVLREAGISVKVESNGGGIDAHRSES